MVLIRRIDMNASAGSLSEMVNSSVDVLRRPSVATFERYERRGNLQKALVYVGLAALVALVLGLFGGLQNALGDAIGVFVQFLLFAGVTYYLGTNQGGTGSLDEVAYTFSLFIVPIYILSSLVLVVLLLIPILGWCLIPFALLGTVIAYVYYGYLAVQSSMNFTDTTRVLVTLGVAALVTVVGNVLINALF
jgi:hypothetical protein